MIEVKFEDTNTSTSDIEKAFTKAGHDSPNFKAKDEVYEKLPACCKYEQWEKEK